MSDHQDLRSTRKHTSSILMASVVTPSRDEQPVCMQQITDFLAKTVNYDEGEDHDVQFAQTWQSI